MISKTIESKDVLRNTLDILGLSPSSFALLVGKNKSSLSHYLKNEVQTPAILLSQAMTLLTNAGVNPLEAPSIPDEKDHYYHAAPVPLQGPIDVFKNLNNHNDFGGGFYLGESLLQSSSYQKGKSSELYLYRFKKDRFTNLNFFDFDQRPSLEWFLFIAINRGKIGKDKYARIIVDLRNKLSSYDALRGKIADSFTFQIIEGLFADTYDLDQAEAYFVILALGDQLCIKNNSFAEKLEPDELYILSPGVKKYFSA